MQSRRSMVRLTGLAAVSAIAGCSGSGSDGTPAPDERDDTETDANEAETQSPESTETAEQSYSWQDATWDSYWYSLYNMSTNIAMSSNGVQFPHNDAQRKAFSERFPAMLSAANQPGPPIKDPNLNMAPFTEGDPHFTQKPVLEGDDGRPDATTLKWDPDKSSQVVSPSSLAWTHMKGVTWAKNFENHFDILPDNLAAEFRSMVLSTLAQIGVNAALIKGGPKKNGALTKGETMELVSEFRPGPGAYAEETHFTPPDSGGYPDRTSRPHHHAAMLWFLSDLSSLATGGWFGYENPKPLIPAKKIQQLRDGLAKTVMDQFAPTDVVEAEGTRGVGLMLGGVGWFGTQTDQDELVSGAQEYADNLASAIDDNLDGNGRLSNTGVDNQAAAQGIVGQGLVWASEIDGVDQTDTAESVLGYMVDELWDDDAGTFATAPDDDTYRITARDAGDVTGGINAAEAQLGMDLQDTFARYFDETFNRGRLQRAERPQSRNKNAGNTLPLPPAAGGEFGQAAVYNGAIEYDTGSDAWSVVDDRFYTGEALYLANQDIWIGQWGGDFYEGRGLPGANDTAPN